jgi:predicted RNase H-like HicB family nuclease
VPTEMRLQVASPNHGLFACVLAVESRMWCINLRGVVQAMTFTARYETVEDGWVQATIDELPSVITAAPSYEEAKEGLVDALHEYLLALGDLERHPTEARQGDAEPLLVTVNA